MKKILVIAGPSAVGKTTVMKKILSINPNFEFIRSATTRAPRGDGHDSEYLYLSKEEFQERIALGKMLEHTEFGGNFYGTPASEIERIFALGKTPILILDINGVRTLKETPRDFSVVAVYITAEMKVLISRLRERAEGAGMTAEASRIMEGRIEQNRRDLSDIEKILGIFDATLENITVDNTAREILSVFEKTK